MRLDHLLSMEKARQAHGLVLKAAAKAAEIIRLIRRINKTAFTAGAKSRIINKCVNLSNRCFVFRVQPEKS